MAVNLTRLFALFSVFCALATTAGTVRLEEVKTWAKTAGEKLSLFFNDATKFKKLQEAYNQNLQSAQLSVARKDGIAIVNDMKSVLEGVLQKKIKSIKNLAKKTQGLRSNYTYEDNPTDFDFYNSKDLPEDFPLEKHPTFSEQVDINKNNSVVHIPTDVYSGGVTIQNTIKWTNGLDPYFKENEEEDRTLLWQYFGGSDGVYRVYPGFKWPDPSDTDIFDNRRRGWYIQGSSSPKDIVLLLDLSGSMAGQKLAILKLAAMSLLETLQENDFVNIVVVYADEDTKNDNTVKPYMVCQVMKDGKIKTNKNEDCSSDLLQATQQNKKYLKQFVPRAKARGIATISNGFESAIKVLKTSREDRNFTSSDCTQAIILFTDGIEESQAEETRKTLEKDNGNKQIRVFTYLVGSKNATDSSLKDISNEYRGCFFRIKTMSDVREKVLEYVKVLSRPLAFSLGGSVPDPSWTPIYLDKLGLGLMITLVAPVFNKTENKELLGVVGTDVALPQLEDSVPGSEVGVNGYGFAINNNGFVLFHPKLDKMKDPPNIALDELEYNASGSKELMREMINRLTGEMSFKTRFLSEQKHRLSWSEEFHYFYSPVENTSFSAAVAIPKTGMYSLSASGFTGSDAATFLASSDNNEMVKVAPWKICPKKTAVADADQTAVYMPAYPTADDIIKDSDRQRNCNETKLNNLLFDANLTKEVAAKYWKVGNEGIEDVFVATHGGIMRWLNSSDITLRRDYIKEQFYRQAAQYADKADNDNGFIVVSAPYKAPNDQGINGTVTASAPVIVSNDKVVAAVAGLHVKQDDFTQLLLGAIGPDNCSITNGCSSYFIDDDGFVVASNKEDGTEVGKFFGVLEGAAEGVVMNYFVNRSLFEKLTFKSVQEECEKPKLESSNARRLLNPLFAVTSYVQFWTQTVLWSLVQFNINSLFSRGGVAMAEGEQENMIPCSKEFKFYKQDWEKNNYEGFAPCGSCDRPAVFMARVPNTNLQLVIIKGTCLCDDKQLTTKPENLLEDIPSPSNVFYRKPPEVTPPCDDMNAEQGKPPCALASFSSPGSVTMVLLLILALFIPYNDNWR